MKLHMIAAAAACLVCTAAQAQPVQFGPMVDVKLSQQQVQTITRGLDLMLRNDGMQSAGVVLDAANAINQAIGAAQVAATRAQIKAEDDAKAKDEADKKKAADDAAKKAADEAAKKAEQPPPEQK